MKFNKQDSTEILAFYHKTCCIADSRHPRVTFSFPPFSDFCQNPENEVTLQVQETLEMLRQDKDRDVGHFACCPMNTDCLLDPHDPTL